MDRWKSKGGKSQRREEKRREEKRSEKRKSQKKEDASARGRKVAKHCVFPMSCGSGGSRSRLAKAASAEPPGRMSDEKLRDVAGGSTFASMWKLKW